MLHGNLSNFKCLRCCIPCKKKNYANYAVVPQSPGTAVCRQTYACNDPKGKSHIKKDGGGRRLPHKIKKRTGVLVRNLEKIPHKMPRCCFVGIAWIVSTQEIPTLSPVILVWLNTLKGTVKASAVDFLRPNSLHCNSYQNCFLTSVLCCGGVSPQVTMLLCEWHAKKELIIIKSPSL